MMSLSAALKIADSDRRTYSAFGDLTVTQLLDALAQHPNMGNIPVMAQFSADGSVQLFSSAQGGIACIVPLVTLRA